MSNKVTIVTIANDLGLTTGTVSRVLNGKARQFRISQKTVSLVENYARDKGYEPNLVAKGLQASKTFTIGLMIPDIANPFFALLAKYIEHAASKANYSIILVDSEENPDKEIKQVKNLIGRKVDGIIASPVGRLFNHFTDLKSLNIPVVFVDRYFVNCPTPYITSNNFQGAYDATMFLIGQGHKRIGLLKGDEITEPVKERARGYKNALQSKNIEIDIELIAGNSFTIENGYESAKRLLNLKQKPTALFAMSNLIGLGALQAINEACLTIPDDISLIIFDDQPYMAFLNPPITTVKQNSETIAEMAVELLLGKLENKSGLTENFMVPVQILERASVSRI